MFDWSRPALAAWGKTDRDTGESLPVVVHLADAAGVAGWLWDRWVPDIVRARCSGALGGDEPARALVTFLAGAHDVGKVSPAFAVKAAAVGMEHLLDEMRRAGLTTPTVLATSDNLHHTVVGHLAVTSWLVDTWGWSRRAADSVAVVVGAHHGVPPERTTLHEARSRARALGGPSWSQVRLEILDQMSQACGLEPLLRAMADEPLPLTTQVDLSAVVILADWIASDSQSFPYEHCADPERLDNALRHLDLPPPWRAERTSLDIDSLLSKRFPRLAAPTAHPVQRAAIEAAGSATRAPLLVIESPMGSGKTEAALLAAEVLAARFGCGGVYVGLPTMATTDPMFTRLLGWLEGLPGRGAASVYLAHSKAGLNDEFRDLLRAGRPRGVFDDDDPARNGASVHVSSWLAGRKKGMLANFVAGTVDQALYAGLKAKHLALRHLALSGKVVVIDEVHAADDYMRAYLRSVLTWLAAYGTPVILMSATLPAAQRQELVEAYAAGRRVSVDPRAVAARESYPRITMVDDATHDVAVVPPDASTAAYLERLADPNEVLVRRLHEELVDGGCVGVVRNTVSRAQETYAALREEFGTDVILTHSRFVATHRAVIERGIRERLGPPGGGTVRPRRLIVVGTQTLEQSLDIDFDLLITDLCPVDLLLQRIGRLHRHERSGKAARPQRLRRARCLVSGAVDWAADPPEAVSGSRTVYGSAKLLRAAAVLRPHLDGAALALPGDIRRLVEEGYDPGLAPPAGWEDVWSAAVQRDDEKRARQLAESRTFRIDVPDALSLVDWLRNHAGEADSEGSASGRAQVRDSEDSIEVIVVRREPDGRLTTLDAGGGKPVRDLPWRIDAASAALARELAASTLRLPAWLCRGARGDRVVSALEASVDVSGWQDSPWLRGQLVLPLDAGTHLDVADVRLDYDEELGLRVTKHEGDDDDS